MKSITDFLLLLTFLVLTNHFGTATANAQKRQEKQEIQQAPKTLITVLQKTYSDNPTLQSARVNLKAVQEQLPQALSGWMPTVLAETSIRSNDIDSNPTSTADGSTAKNIGLSLNQPLYQGGTTLAQTRSARHVIRARKASLISQEQNILLQTVTAYMDVVQNRALLDLSENNKALITRQHEATLARFEVGELTKTDTQQAAARLANAQALIINARGNLRSTEAVFERLTGFKPAPALETPSAVLDLPATLDDATAESKDNNPEIIAAISTARAAQNDIDGIFGELLPNVSLSASWDKTYDPSPGLLNRQTDKTIGISASIPLYKAGNVRSRVRQAKHTANQRDLEIREQKRLIREETIKSWENLQTTKAEIKARQAQLKSSTIAQEGVTAETEFGSRTVLDALDADQELLDAQVALVSAQRDKVVAEFTLLSVLGHLTPEYLDLPVRP